MEIRQWEIPDQVSPSERIQSKWFAIIATRKAIFHPSALPMLLCVQHEESIPMEVL